MSEPTTFQWQYFRLRPSGTSPVREYLDGLPQDDKVKLLAAMKLVKEHGPHNRQIAHLARSLREAPGIHRLTVVGPTRKMDVFFGADGPNILAVEARDASHKGHDYRAVALASNRLVEWSSRLQRRLAQRPQPQRGQVS